MRAPFVLLAALLAGCAQAPPGSFTVELDAASPASLLDRFAAPEGFVQEQAFAQQRIDGIVEGQVRTFARGDWSQRERIVVGLQLHDSHERAAAELERLTHDPMSGSPFAPIDLGDGAYAESFTRSGGAEPGGSSGVVARVDGYVFWLGYEAVGLAPQLEAEPMARELAAIVESR